jgi:hypothetical protein
MSLLEPAATVQDKVLEAIKAGQNAVLSAVNTIAESAAPITSILSAVPFADRLPKPVDVVDTAFGFAEKLLASQKEFTTKLVDAYGPGKPFKVPAKV